MLGRSASADEPGRAPFVARNDPPFFRPLGGAERAAADLGQRVFNTSFLPAGTSGAARIAGLGPLYNAASCDACHNDGARASGPAGDGPVPIALVLRLASPTARNGQPAGDPMYGRTLNTSAVDGVAAEGQVRVRYAAHKVRFADGATAELRVPTYEVVEPSRGPLAATTVLQPRIAPAIFGTGLLDMAVAPCTATGRFGWQSETRSVREQTATAFAREMGLTTSEVPADDRTPAELAAGAAAAGGAEIDAALLAALVTYERLLAVPATARDAGIEVRGNRLFIRLGCVACHTPSLRVPAGALGDAHEAHIQPYTDLRLHDLGEALADRDVTGHAAPTRFRTAPLWGLGYRPRPTSALTFLHDGRARTVTEAILWHDGEARPARRRFMGLRASDRALLDQWVLER